MYAHFSDGGDGAADSAAACAVAPETTQGDGFLPPQGLGSQLLGKAPHGKPPRKAKQKSQKAARNDKLNEDEANRGAGRRGESRSDKQRPGWPGPRSQLKSHPRELNVAPCVAASMEGYTRPADCTVGPPPAEVVMDPLAVLRQCIQHFLAHPEHYGSDLHALLTQQVTHVVRLKASEAALTVSLDSAHAPEGGPSGLRGKDESLLLPPLTAAAEHSSGVPTSAGAKLGASKRTMAGASRTQPHAPRRGDDADTGRFGFGGTLHFMEPSPGLLALIADGRSRGDTGSTPVASPTPLTLNAGTATNALVPAAVGGGVGAASTTLQEAVQWGAQRAAPFAAAPLSPRDERHETTTAVALYDDSDADRNDSRQHEHLRDDDEDDASDAGGPSQLYNVTLRPSGGVTTPAGARGAGGSSGGGAAGRVVLLDANGYEVTFLQGQLQQVEAAYNAKCVRLYELVEENKRLLSQLAAADATAANWQRQHAAAQNQIDGMQRELDAWRDRAEDGVISAKGGTTAGVTVAGGRRASLLRRAQATQLNEVKREVVKLTQLWRETERALQESRRAFENSEKEATQSHDHLSDAFHYIERLERRVARRDAFLALTSKRQASLEEKYEKLMWCFQELGSMTGPYSYADYLLADEPLWTLVLFALLQRHGDWYSPVEVPASTALVSSNGPTAAPPAPSHSPSATADASVDTNSSTALLRYVPSPGGGRLTDAVFDTATVYRMMANEATAVDERRGRTKRLRTNLHGTVGCRVLRWQKRFAIDFLGGEDSFPDSCELNKKKLPVLTLAALLLPPCKHDGSLLEMNPPAPANAGNGAGMPVQGETPADGGASATSTIFATIPNPSGYDRATVRLVLRSFWRQRVEQYRRSMYIRVKLSVEENRRRARQESRKSQRTTAQRGAAVKEDDDDDDGDGNDESDRGNAELRDYSSGFARGYFGSTFLGALVEFVQHHADGPGGKKPDANQSRDCTAWIESVLLADTASRHQPDTERRGGAHAAAGGPLRYVVRGVAPRSGAGGGVKGSANKEIWDNGRVFFASVLDPTTGPTARGEALAGKTAGGETTITPTTASVPNMSSPVTEPSPLTMSARARELLCAIYYYTMEFKDTDADFRLFYLVSHQLLPEMAGVNFFASIEAFEEDCYATLRDRLVARTANEHTNVVSSDRDTFAVASDRMDEIAGSGKMVSKRHAEQLTSLPPTCAVISKSPLDVLCHVVDLIDRTPLAGEEERIEEDSDGEGYHSVLPGDAVTVNTVKGSRAVKSATPTAKGPPSAPAAASAAGGSHEDRSADTVDGVAEQDAGTRCATASPSASREPASPRTLVHNIRAYLSSLASEKAGQRRRGQEESRKSSNAETEETSVASPRDRIGSSDSRSASAAEVASNASDDEDAQPAAAVPGRWEKLDACVRRVLAPHSSMLSAFLHSESVGAKPSSARQAEGFLARQRSRRVQFHEERSKALAAARGLMPLDDVLRILTKHVFTSYALTCCGSPHFSLAETLMPFGSSAHWRDYITPLSPVGQLPATEIHLKRLRFALALDHPSALVRFSDVFTFDARTNTPTHLYDEYLTLWLDVCQQQQCFCMDIIQRACASRHEQFMSEGAEDCDGSIPISFLRKGVRGAMAELGFGVVEADAFVEHMVNYSRILREEDDVQCEQFTDGPFFLNTSVHAAANGKHSDEQRGQAACTAAPGGGTTGVGHGNSEGALPCADPPKAPPTADSEWDFNDESESSSLLHLALAVRMLYVVWGFDCADATRKLAETLCAIPLHVPFSLYRSQHDSLVQHAGARRLGNGVGTTVSPPHDSVTTAPLTANLRGAKRSLHVQDDHTRQLLLMHNFQENVKAAYTRALQRLTTATTAATTNSSPTPGSSAESVCPPHHDNPLRRTALDALQDAEGGGGPAASAAQTTAAPGSTAGGGVRELARRTSSELYPVVFPLSALYASDIKERREAGLAKSIAQQSTSTGKRKTRKTPSAGRKKAAPGASAAPAAPAATSKAVPGLQAGSREHREGDGDADPAAAALCDSVVPAVVLREVREPPADHALYTLARLVGLGPSPGVAGARDSAPHSSREDKHGAKKKSKKLQQGGQYEGPLAGFAPATAVNTTSLIGQLCDRIDELTEPLRHNLETTAAARVGGFNSTGKRRLKSVGVVTVEESAGGECAAVASGPHADAQRKASFVPSEDVVVDDPSASSAGLRETPTTGTSATVGGTGSLGIQRSGTVFANRFSFALDWLPPSSESRSEPAQSQSARASRATSALQPQQVKAPALVKPSGEPSRGGANQPRDDNALYVSLLHGACAALSLL